MGSVESKPATDEIVYIELDDPTRWWSSIVGLTVAILIVLVLVAPWVITLQDNEYDAVANGTLQNTGSVCRPNASGLPNIFDPTVASWSRFCDWFIAPQMDPQDTP